MINSWVKFATVSAGTFTSAISTGITIGSNYFIRIVAVNVVGSSPSSNTVQIWAATVPSKPINLLRTAGTNT